MPRYYPIKERIDTMTITKKMENLIEKNMKALRISYEEAKALVEDDMIIDKGGRCDWEPSIEEERAMRKATKLVGERKKSTSVSKRAPKKDSSKELLISNFKSVLNFTAGVEDVEIVNKNRAVSFNFKNENFDITLTRKRERSTKHANPKKKVDENKTWLIDMLYRELNGGEDITDVDMLNPERVIAFTYKDEFFEVVLARKAKK